MDDKTRIYTIKNPASAVIIPAKTTAMKAKIERSLSLKIEIIPVTRLISEKIPAMERDSNGRG
ncbi:MAG: hypothetical protein P8105_09930 [Dehalococcoidia bacterium]